MSELKVGVLLPRPPIGPGEWLDEATAFESAGADALWVDHGRTPQHDPLVLTAALAALTYRSLIFVSVPEIGPAALATLASVSHGRVTLIGEGTVHRLPGGGYQEEGKGPWTPITVPDGRASWRESLRLASERGDCGVLVPADPLLIDILRNPDDPGGRHDLHLAQG